MNNMTHAKLESCDMHHAVTNRTVTFIDVDGDCEVMWMEEE